MVMCNGELNIDRNIDHCRSWPIRSQHACRQSILIIVIVQVTEDFQEIEEKVNDVEVNVEARGNQAVRYR